MSRKDAEFEGFLRGLATAEKIAKEVEADPDGGRASLAIAKQIKMRRTTGVTIAYTKKEWERATETIKKYTLNTTLAMTMIILYEQQQWGKVRLKRFCEEFLIHSKAMLKGEIDWVDILECLKAETDIEIDFPKELLQRVGT